MKINLEYLKDQRLWLGIILIISGLIHAINMFGFPYYENDEGVYMSQAWSLLTMGKLSPYTYWYDHAPMGWIFIALWSLISGGFFAFGFSINSGRVLMLILQIANTLFLFLITKKLTNNNWVSAFAALIFSFTPLGIYFHRRVLLDNIMTFWLLLSLILILGYKNKLRFIILSGIAFGIAILTKENAIFFIPIFLYLIYLESHSGHKIFALTSWLSLALVVTSTYFLYAQLKGELFPSGTFIGGNEEHVSLLATLKEQSSRGGGGIRDIETSSFWNSARVWVSEDPIIIYVGVVATLINLLIGIKQKVARVVALLSLSMWAFLMRGGLVIEFYVVPLLPLLALNIAVVFWQLILLVKRVKPTFEFHSNLALVLPIFAYIATALYYSANIRGDLSLFTSNQTKPQIQAVDWILAQDTPQAFYVIDNYGYIDLQVNGKDKNFKNAEWYWKVDRDPAIRLSLLKDKPDDIDFIALTPQMEHDITSAGLDITLAAWHNSNPYARFWSDGWGVEFWGTNYPRRILESTWESYKQDFIVKGRVFDPYQDNITTSEAQAYAMLRAVLINDQSTFDEIYSWTESNLQQPNGLFSWKWQNNIVDKGTASDADQDAALALLFAYKQWNDTKYLVEAQHVLNGIWETEVVKVNNTYYMTAANWANHIDAITLNPSYLSPAYYRIFAKADKSHPWEELVQSSYEILTNCTLAKLDKASGTLPPEWCSLNKLTHTFSQPGEFQPRATEYGYNAFRVPLRVAMDYAWYRSEDAKNYLKELDFLYSEYSTTKKIKVAYQHDGSAWEEYESVAAYSGNFGYFYVEHPEIAKEIYEEKIRAKFYEDKNKSYWEDPKNYYTQNLAWFATALYTNNIPNLWPY